MRALDGVSHADGVFAMRLSSARPTMARVRLVAGNPRDVVREDGSLFEAPIRREGTVEEGVLHLRGSYTTPPPSTDAARGGFGIVARVFHHGGGAATPAGVGPEAGIDVELDGPLVILVGTYAGSTDPAGAAAGVGARLDAIGGDWDGLLERHAAVHRRLFLRTTLDLAPDAPAAPPMEQQLLDVASTDELSAVTLQQMADFGRYLLLGSAGGTTPSHLQGVWNGDHEPPWWCFYMANENVQMNHWQALTGGLPEVVRSLFDLYEGFLDDFRANARQLFGCRGIVVPAFITPDTGWMTTSTPHIVYWISGAGWLAQHFAELDRHFPDPEFRRTKLVPFLSEAVLFLEDFLHRNSAGDVVVCPSTSPENVPGNFAEPSDGGGMIVGTVRLTCNATLDVAVARELIASLLEFASADALPAQRRARLASLVEGLPAYATDESGEACEWLDPRFGNHNQHRHLSHLYPVFPGREIDALADPEAAEPFRRAMHARGGIGLQQQTGWSLAHMANAAARLDEPERAMNCLTLLMKTCVGSNFFTYHNDHRGSGVTLDLIWGRRPPFQVDANMGVTAAVYEMLFRSRPGRIDLLPALPRSLPRGSASGLHGHGGVVVDLAWDRHAGRLEAVVHGLPEGTRLRPPPWCPEPAIEHRPPLPLPPTHPDPCTRTTSKT